MKFFAPRTCTEIEKAPRRAESQGAHEVPVTTEGGISEAEALEQLDALFSEAQPPQQGTSRALMDFRKTDAYVLLGAPGAGKTTSFQQEADATEGHYVTARDFLTFDDKPEWHGATLFIDAFDERRAGLADGRTPLDQIRSKLHTLGCPAFRLACREADWFGANDREHLKEVSPSQDISVIRLDPLSEEDVATILSKNFDVSNPQEFIASARAKGIGSLLTNPQSLRMLVKAVNQSGDGTFPASRTETFDLACRTLLRELNSDHQLAGNEAFDIEALMEAAGRLCAVQLLAGTQGYALPGAEGGPDFPELAQVSGGDRRVLRHVLGTKFFEAPSEGHVIPIHRQAAEFLAARHLSRLIGESLPLRRALSLMTANDGAVVPELRGLSAWLAVHNKGSRLEIIDRDPLGTVLYGDASTFSTYEKRRILQCLKKELKEGDAYSAGYDLYDRLGDIATPDMEGEFQALLEASAKDPLQQSLVWILLMSLAHGSLHPGFQDALIVIIRRDDFPVEIKDAAADILIRQTLDAAKAYSALKNVLEDVDKGSILDPENRLLALLLAKLYPQALSAPEVLKHLRPAKLPSSCMEYQIFWSYGIFDKTQPTDAAQLLDGLAEEGPKLLERFKASGQFASFLPALPARLMSFTLQNSEEAIDPHRLIGWLGAVAWNDDVDYFPHNGNEWTRDIASWLSDCPELQKSLLNLAVQTCLQSAQSQTEEEFNGRMMRLQRRFFDPSPPSDFGDWCVDQALAATNSLEARYFLMRALDADYGGKEADEAVGRRIACHPHLKSLYGELLDARITQLENARRIRDGYAQRVRDREVLKEGRRGKWREEVKPHEEELRENRALPGLLHNLAKAYLGGYGDVRGGRPEDRLRVLLGADDPLIGAVLDGLRGSIERSDIPSDAETIRLNTENKRHLLALPIVAGLEDRATAAPDSRLKLDDKQMRSALAIHYTEPNWGAYIGGNRSVDVKSIWFPPLLESHPEVVSDVLVKFAGSKFRSGDGFVEGLYELAHSKDHKAVARLASLPLLEMFPTRCTERQLPGLRHLLHAACLHCDKRALADLIERKLAARSMNVSQRVYWLAAGLLVSPDSFVEMLDSYVAGKQRRIRHLAAILGKWFDVPRGLLELLGAPALKTLAKHVGATCQPYPSGSEGGGFVTPRMEAGMRVGGFINRLASMPSKAATDALAELSDDDGLRAWRPLIMDAVNRQKIARREADYQHCSIKQTIATLNNGPPANAGDLAALTTDHMHDIAKNIRDGNTSDWRQYWNVDSHNRPEKPKPEDACRDALLSDLQLRLAPLGIDGQPEGRYADDKRSDIRVSRKSFNVPVEIKKSCHGNLWSAIRTQLIEKYARDPGADGFGIYLVFWFGNTEHCRPTPGEGAPPKGADELATRLQQTLSEEEGRKVSICVIDIAAPVNRRK